MGGEVLDVEEDVADIHPKKTWATGTHSVRLGLTPRLYYMRPEEPWQRPRRCLCYDMFIRLPEADSLNLFAALPENATALTHPPCYSCSQSASSPARHWRHPSPRQHPRNFIMPAADSEHEDANGHNASDTDDAVDVLLLTYSHILCH